MPAFAPNFTPRYKLGYSTAGRRYDVQFRLSANYSLIESSVDDFVAGFLTVTAPIRYNDWTVEEAEVSNEGADIFLPVTAPTNVPGALVNPPVGTARSPASTGFIGRSNGGSRAGFFLFGGAVVPTANAQQADWRVTAAENTDIAAIITYLRNAGAGLLVAIDGLPIVWKNYANVNYNSYLVRRARG